MILRALSFLLGYVELRVEGRHLERFVNLAVSNGIYVWDVRRLEGELRLRMGLRAFRRLRPVARRARCRIRVLGRRGFPFLLRRVARRRVLWVGAAAAFLLLYVLSAHVWFIQVDGLQEVPERRVLAALDRLGLRPGVAKRGLQLERMADRLPIEVPELAWAGIHIRGTRAVVRVAERTVLLRRQAPDEAPADVVAAKDGVITRVLVLMGESVVSEGQTVRRGQVLIRGHLTPYEGEPPQDAGKLPPPRRVRARGMVRARVWYDTYAETPLRPEIAARTGAVFTRRLVRVAGKTVVLSGFGKVPFADYQREETVVRPAAWRKNRFPVELFTLKYYEVVRRVETLTQGEALRRAQAEAKRRLLERIPVTARILRETTQVLQGDGQVVGVRLAIETEEDIGRVRVLPSSAVATPPNSVRRGSRLPP